MKKTYTLATLTGSEKQIAWAEDIRQKVIDNGETKMTQTINEMLKAIEESKKCGNSYFGVRGDDVSFISIHAPREGRDRTNKFSQAV